MLVDTQYMRNSKKLVVSYIDKGGDIKLKYFDWAKPMKFENCFDDDSNRHPTYKSWDGQPVKLVETNNPDRYAIYEFLDALPNEERHEIFDFNAPKIFFVDIETEIVDGFPEAIDIKDANGNVVTEGAATMVQAISIVYDDKIMLLGIKELSKESQERIESKTNEYFKKFNVEYKLRYIKYDDEFDMLYAFFNKFVPKMPCISGWNFLQYDWMFLVNRVRKLSKIVNGIEYKINPSISSPTSRMNKIWTTDYEVPVHRIIVDYMQLYKILDTSIKVKESNSLDFVASKLVGVEKIKYNGSLQTLYENDFEKFMYYNAVDSILVQRIHLARNYVSIIYAISALAQIKLSDVVSQRNNALASLAITEGVLRNRYRDMDNIVMFRQNGDNASDEAEELKGGYVKDPVVGMNRFVSVYDFLSLYPHVQLQWFISPENFIGLIDKKDNSRCTNGTIIDTLNHVVCINGTVFRKVISPTINMLNDIFHNRKKNKKIMMSKKEMVKEIENEIKKLEEML